MVGERLSSFMCKEQNSAWVFIAVSEMKLLGAILILAINKWECSCKIPGIVI